MRRSERPFKLLPRPLLWLFASVLALQLAYHHANRRLLEAAYRPLAEPAGAPTNAAAAAGSEQ